MKEKDIVERLRAMNPPDPHEWGDCRKAADEIERLRADRDSWRDGYIAYAEKIGRESVWLEQATPRNSSQAADHNKD